MSEKKVENIFTCTVNLVESRQITVNGNFYADDSPEDMNRKLDAVLDVMERQRKRFELPVMQKELEARLKALQNNMDQMEALQKELTAKGGKGNAAQLRMNIQTYSVNISKIRKDIEDGQKAIQELEREVADGVRAA